MSQVSRFTLDKLSGIADDLYEIFSARGHRISVALETDRSFGRYSNRPKSALGRELALEAIIDGARLRGFEIRHRAGGTELVAPDGAQMHHYRLLKGARTPDGDWRIPTNSRSALTIEDEESLFTEVRRVFSWNVAEETVLEVITARVIDHVEGNPGYLVLDQVQVLGGSGRPGGSRGFIPTDEDLPGFEGDDFGDASATA